jgi:hypothetical protein
VVLVVDNLHKVVRVVLEFLVKETLVVIARELAGWVRAVAVRVLLV